MKYLFTIIFLISLSFSSFSQENEMWVKISPEIRLNLKKLPLEFRWRPVDHLFLPNKYIAKYSDRNNFGRTDIMAGVKFWKIKLFSYSKFDEFGRMWTGARLDLNFSFLNKKILLNIQERYFWGLNDKSSEHYYLVQLGLYNINKYLQAGILSYGKWSPARDFNQGDWFIGPVVNFKMPYNFYFMASVTKNIFKDPVYMTFLRLGYNFKL